jgi:outer membrane protein assembly factor BamB
MRLTRFSLGVLGLCAAGALPLVAADTDWPQFRGRSAGVSDNAGLPDAWGAAENVAWATPVPGRGWSSPVVSGDLVFLTSVVGSSDQKKAAKGLYFGGEQKKPPEDEHRWVVFAVDAATGRVRWEREAARGVPASTTHSKNSYASETPVADSERVYAYFGNKGLYCYDRAGNLAWSKTWPAYPTKFGWGPAASPVLHGGRLFVVNDNEKESFLVALDAKTGDEVWRVARDEKSNWATPYVWENGKRAELITAGAGKVRAYDPATGKVLWEFGGMSKITIPTPFARNGLLYVASGYVMDQTRPVFAVKPGASGDITLPEDADSGEYIAWRQKKAGPYNPTPLVYGDYLYVLYDMGFLACYEAKTGKQVYDRQRLQGPFTASPWAYDGKVFCLNEDGTTHVIKAGPEFQVLRSNKLDEMTLATPALSGDRLFLRTQTKLYCIKKR